MGFLFMAIIAISLLVLAAVWDFAFSGSPTHEARQKTEPSPIGRIESNPFTYESAVELVRLYGAVLAQGSSGLYRDISVLPTNKELIRRAIRFLLSIHDERLVPTTLIESLKVAYISLADFQPEPVNLIDPSGDQMTFNERPEELVKFLDEREDGWKRTARAAESELLELKNDLTRMRLWKPEI